MAADSYCLKDVIDSIHITPNTIYYLSIGSMCHSKTYPPNDTCLSQIFPRFVYINSNLLKSGPMNVHLLAFDEYDPEMIEYVLDNYSFIEGERAEVRQIHDCPNKTNAFTIGDNLRIDFVNEFFPIDNGPGKLLIEILDKHGIHLHPSVGRSAVKEEVRRLTEPKIAEITESITELVRKAAEVKSVVIVGNFVKFLRDYPQPKLHYLSSIRDTNYLYLGWKGYGGGDEVEHHHHEILMENDNDRTGNDIYFAGYHAKAMDTEPFMIPLIINGSITIQEINKAYEGGVFNSEEDDSPFNIFLDNNHRYSKSGRY